MSVKYDGWTVKMLGNEPFLCKGFFQYTRKDVIDEFEKLIGKGSWAKKRRRGEVKLVKVRVTEVVTEVGNEQ